MHFSRLTAHDVVRHRLVGEIVDAYDALRRQQPTGATAAGASGRARERRATP